MVYGLIRTVCCMLCLGEWQQANCDIIWTEWNEYLSSSRAQVFAEANLMARNRKKIIYSLNIEDIQTVAQETLSRDLTDKELERVIEEVPRYVHWYDAIDNAIFFTLVAPSKDKRED
jgi:hypothetical protein